MRHPIDLLGGAILSHGPHRLRFFTEGWGPDHEIARMELPPPAAPAAIDIEWGDPLRHDGVAFVDGAFTSPATWLVGASRTARVRLVEPAGGSERVCLLMAAWNDHTYATRQRLAGDLAERQIACLLLQQPFYGLRRPDPDVHQPIRTVADFAAMGSAALEEGRALLAWLRDEGRSPGVSGYSMGGNMAALIAATVPFRIATAPLAASHSPSPVYLDGVLRAGIDWEALGGETASEDRLRRVMLQASVLRIEPPPHTRHAIIVAARRDAYVPRRAVIDLHDHWPGSELRWLPGGHATVLWFRRSALADAVADAFARTFPTTARSSQGR